MLYQLPTGRVIEITVDQYFELTDEEIEYLIAYNYGDIMENPWFGSILSKKAPALEIIEEIVIEITDLSQIEKLEDLDLDQDIFEE